MKRMDFKMVKDGSRTIIVLDGADSETDAALYRILCAACGIEAPIGAAEQAATKSPAQTPSTRWTATLISFGAVPQFPLVLIRA